MPHLHLSLQSGADPHPEADERPAFAVAKRSNSARRCGRPAAGYRARRRYQSPDSRPSLEQMLRALAGSWWKSAI